MIVINLIGGLGNQMFQYALGRSLSLRRGEDLYLDISNFKKNYLLRRYELDIFRFQKKYANQKILNQIKYGKENPSIITKITRQVRRKLDYDYTPGRYFERNLRYSENVFSCPSNVIIYGYFQCEKYFLDIKNVIQSDFEIIVPPNEKNAKELQIIQNSKNSVAVHFRRGDYVTDSNINQFHGVCDISYYSRAIEFISHKLGDLNLFLFSDDPEWVKNNFKTDHQLHIVDINNGDSSYEDLRLMQSCSHFIIANSSFSWWGAWLSMNEDKIVVAPKQWFNEPFNQDAQDIVCSNWIKL